MSLIAYCLILFVLTIIVVAAAIARPFVSGKRYVLATLVLCVSSFFWGLLLSCSTPKADSHKYDAERSWGAVSKTMPKGKK
jgi:hypothetical protein